ncbi:MAG TPA: HAMP domain-containing sensor histidine kinase [Polyangiaceae bacterium]|nr:HAMP domain-containing sensor histidine kinase [Polyangiaceae bacterium]
MNPAASHLVRRVLGWFATFTLLVALVVALLAPRLLLLSGETAIEGAAALGSGMLAGGAVAALVRGIRLFRYRFLLRALAVGSRAVEAHQLYELGSEPRRSIVGWLVPSGLGAAIATIPFAPSTLDSNTSVTLCLLGLAILTAASLPLFVVLRTTFARALMLAPPEVMREVVEDAERLGHIRGRVARRMVLAVTLPVLCLAVGASLIVVGHLRRADERSREEAARTLARAALEPGPGPLPWAGIPDALLQARALGFYAYSQQDSEDYRVERGRAGRLIVTMPLDRGSASVEFASSTANVVSPLVLLIALVATAVAALLGMLIGRALSQDLWSATRDVRELGTEAVIEGGRRVVRSARFHVVAQLGSAIARLAGRFRVFARAQERSIDARNAAARTRGLFFASVSHDLKSPLNAILGFTELVRRAQFITLGQAESLSVIERRGRELLALIETILDAARVEAGQLTLVLDSVDAASVIEQAVQKGRDLTDGRDVQAVLEIAPDLPKFRADRVRLSRALATFIAYAMREATTPSLRIAAGLESATKIRIEIEVPSERFRESDLSGLLKPPDAPGAAEHRGLALALRLGRSIVELHGGTVAPVRRAGVGAFALVLPSSG